MAPSNTTVIAATEADLPAIASLAGIVWRACYPGIISPEQINYMLARMYAVDAMREEIRSQGIHYARLLADGELVGFSAYGPADTADEFKLHKLYLHPDRHGQGLGRRLLQHGEREAGKSARRLILNVNKQNAKAIAFYQRNGFRIADSVVVNIGGGFVMDDYVMAKEITL